MSDAPDGKPPAPGEQAPPDSALSHRRNVLAGLWAAELLGLIGQAAHDYAQDLSRHHAGDHHEAVLTRLARDLAGHASLAEIREKLAHFLDEARRQIHHEKRN